MRGDRAKHDRIAVGPRASSAADTDASISTTDVFDDDRLANQSSQAVGHDPTDRIEAAAGRKRRDHGNGPRWIRLRLWTARDGRQRGGTHCQAQELTARVLTRGTRFRERTDVYTMPRWKLRRWGRGCADRSLHDALHKSVCGVLPVSRLVPCLKRLFVCNW